MFKDVFLLVHPTLGVLGMAGALWVFVEAFHPDDGARRRMKVASLVTLALMALTWVAGGTWDTVYFAADRAVMEKSALAPVGEAMMETKEHLFVLVLLLAAYLPVVVYRTDPRADRGARTLTTTVSGLLVLSALAMEGAGATLALAVKSGLFQAVGA